ADQADEAEQRDGLDGRVAEADVVRQDEQLVPRDGEVARVEQQAAGEGPEEVGVLDRVDPERAEERAQVEALVDLVAARGGGVDGRGLEWSGLKTTKSVMTTSARPASSR